MGKYYSIFSKYSVGRLFSSNVTCPLVPCMAGGLAESFRIFSDLEVGRPWLPHAFHGRTRMGQECDHC